MKRFRDMLLRWLMAPRSWQNRRHRRLVPPRIVRLVFIINGEDTDVPADAAMPLANARDVALKRTRWRLARHRDRYVTTALYE